MTIFEIADWYEDLLAALRLEGDRLVEMFTDTSNENLLNSLAAQHMREYGRKHRLQGFWARCEWAKTDISFGRADQAFQDWDRAWIQGLTGDIGQIESKALYSHYGVGKCREKLVELHSQLEERVKKDQGRPQQRYLGMVLFFVYVPHDVEDAPAYTESCVHDPAWAPLFELAGLAGGSVLGPNRPTFEKLGQLDLHGIWPATRNRSASLWLTLQTFDNTKG